MAPAPRPGRATRAKIALVDAETLSRLLSPTGWALLSTLPPYDERNAMALAERLQREGLDPALVAGALTQSRLRARARAKFAEFADGMIFTQAGLEQATRLVVAARHAQRYAAAGCRRVADITCGIGGDAMALAALGLEVLAVEADELTAAVATVNLRHFAEVEVRHGDGLAIETGTVDGVFADPARRAAGGRRHDPAAYLPPLDTVLALREQVAALGVKVGPTLPHSAVPADAEAQWVSVDGEVVEAGLWFGPLAHNRGRGALVLRGEHAAALAAPADGIPRAEVGSVGTYLYEPDGAVIRAGLVSLVAQAVQGRLLDRTIAYVTSNALTPTDFATAYRVSETMPFGVKRLRAALRARGVGRVTIKKRGADVAPEQLRAQLELRGDGDAVVVVTRVAGQHTALIVEPVS